SVDVLAATVIAPGTRAGEVAQASPPALPAATTTVTPALMAAFTAWSSDEEPFPTSKLRLATIGVCGWARFWATTQFSPLIADATLPRIAQSSTRTETSRASRATP